MLGHNRTTAGAGGAVVTATATVQFSDYVKRPGPLVVQVCGTITLSPDSRDDVHEVTCYKTVGIGSDVWLVDGWLNIGLQGDDVASPPCTTSPSGVRPSPVRPTN